MYFSRVRVNPDIRELSHLHHVLCGNGYSAHQLLWDLFPGEKERTYLFREEIAGEQIPHYKGARGEPIYYVVSQILPTKGNPLFAVESKPYEPQLAVGDHLSFKLRANPVQLDKKVRTIDEIEMWCKRRKDRGDKEKQPTKKRIRHDVVMDAQRHLLYELAEGAGLDNEGEKSDLKRRILDTLLVSKNPEMTAKLKQIIEGNERYQEFLEQRLTAGKLLDMALKAAADSALETWLTEKGKTNGFIIVRDDKRKLLKFQAEGYRWHALPKKGRSAGFSSVDFDGEVEVTDQNLFVNALFAGIGPAKGFGCGLMLVRRV